MYGLRWGKEFFFFLRFSIKEVMLGLSLKDECGRGGEGAPPAEGPGPRQGTESLSLFLEL